MAPLCDRNPKVLYDLNCRERVTAAWLSLFPPSQVYITALPGGQNRLKRQVASGTEARPSRDGVQPGEFPPEPMPTQSRSGSEDSDDFFIN